jgi:hypothetical protein
VEPTAWKWLCNGRGDSNKTAMNEIAY